MSPAIRRTWAAAVCLSLAPLPLLAPPAEGARTPHQGLTVRRTARHSPAARRAREVAGRPKHAQNVRRDLSRTDAGRPIRTSLLGPAWVGSTDRREHQYLQDRQAFRSALGTR